MLSERLSDTLNRLRDAADAAKRPMPTLVAVSKFHPAQAVAELAAAGQRVFGENYVQEAQAKRAELSALALEWHLIGHLQSNKAALAAELFDWVQTVDRPKLVAALAAARSPQRGPLNVLIQVNIDDESSKHGCAPEAVPWRWPRRSPAQPAAGRCAGLMGDPGAARGSGAAAGRDSCA